MVVDMRSQVWLETLPGTIPGTVVAYVLTDREACMTYHMESSPPADDCKAVVFMREGNADRGTFRFDCPREVHHGRAHSPL
jgi:hypothetical protein